MRLRTYLVLKLKIFFSHSKNLNSFVNAWKSSNIPGEQFEIVSKQLTAFEGGDIIPEFKVFLDHLNFIQLENHSKIIEIGCSSGYYSEVVEFYNPTFRYFGIDFSTKFIELALDIYPQKNFLVADANFLPVKPGALDCVVLGSVLLHLKKWEEALKKAADLNSNFLIVHRQPIIIDKPSYYYFKNAYSTKMFEWVINRDHLIEVLLSLNYELVKESIVNFNSITHYSSMLPTTSTFTFKKL